MITEGIVIKLKADTTLAALTTEIVPVGIVKGLKSPCIVYHVGTNPDLNDAQGATGYRLARFQFDCYSGSNYTEAKKVAKALRGALGTFKDTTLTDADSTFVQGCLIDFESDMPFVPTATKTIEFRTMVQVSVWYKES